MRSKEGVPRTLVVGSPLSRRIDLLRFLLIVGLMLLHYGPYPASDISPFSGFQPSPHPLATFINTFILFFFFCAVPLLSAISGWLFFRGFGRSGLSLYPVRLAGRARSILLPMMLWNAIVLGGFVTLANIIPDSRILSIVAFDVTALDLGAVVDALIGVTRHPIADQFWFLRDLMLTILLAPLLWLVMRWIPMAGGAGLFLAWFVGYDFEIFFRADVLFFFYAGGLAWLRGISVETPVPRLALAMFAAFVVLVAGRALGPYFIAEQSSLGVVLFEYGTRVMRIVGALAIWLCSALVVDTRAGHALSRYGALAFFLYAAHWPLNQFFKHGLGLLLPWRNDLVLLANYTLTATLTLASTILAARVLNYAAPSAFDLLSGGRSRMLASRGTAPHESAEQR